MPNYGRYTYGTQYYGVADPGTPLFWLGVDWSGYGYYSGESYQMRDFTIRRGRDQGIQSSGYTNVQEGKLTGTLNNADGRYDYFNASSPLYGYLLPNRSVQIKHSPDGVNVYNLFTGRMSDLRPQTADSIARIEATDGIDTLKNQRVANGALTTNTTVAAAISALLSGAGYTPTDTSLIDDNLDAIPYHWPDPDSTVWAQICEYAQAFAGDPYIAADGRFGYSARQFSEAPLLTLTDADILQDAEAQQPWGDIRNEVHITANPRALSAAMEIWRLSDTTYIDAGDTVTLYARFTSSGVQAPAASVTTPAATTDYTANTAADGSGTNKTAQIAIVMTTYGAEAKLDITNNDAGGVYLTLCKLRGTLYTANAPTTASAVDLASQGNYGIRAFSLDSRWMQSVTEAAYHAAYVKTSWGSPRRAYRVKVKNTAYKFQADLFDVVTFNSTRFNTNATYQITYIEHDYRNGQCTTTWRLEPTPNTLAAYWTFTTALGVSSLLGW